MGSTANRSVRAPSALWEAIYTQAEREGLTPNGLIVRDWSALYLGKAQPFQPPAPRLPPWLARISR